MALLTERDVQANVRVRDGERVLYLAKGDRLTPSARDYLDHRRIPIVASDTSGAPEEKQVYRTLFGATLTEKPEHMTHLSGNRLVGKDHPRILFRGKLDSLQALVVLAQAQIAAGGKMSLVLDLDSVLKRLREIMRCDVLDEPLVPDTIIGLTHAQLREHSHDPMKFYNIKQMVLPDYTMGCDYALLNRLRTAVRETEVAAVTAFHSGPKYTRGDLVEELNRLSSAMHIMMCKYLAGGYKEGGQ